MAHIIISDGDRDIDIEQPMVFSAAQLEHGESLMLEAYPLRTICNVIRRIYVTCKDEEIKRLCVEALLMSKSMNRRLKYYKKDWDKGLWQPDTLGDEYGR